MVKYSNPEEQQLKKHERLQYLTKNDFNDGVYVERKKVNGDSWRLQITTTHVNDFKWLASRAKRKLSYLKLVGVQVDSWAGLEQMKELRVLDLEKIDLSQGLPPQIAPLTEMRALICMSCQLKEAGFLENFTLLNTLILGKNELTSVPSCISTFSRLEKISFSGNDLTADALPDLTHCVMLKQVRLSHNARLSALPDHFGRWTKGDGEESKLECLYLASTGLDGEEALDRIFEHSTSLVELAVSNTPLIKGHEALYEERCKNALAYLKIYNGKRFDPYYKSKNVEKVARTEDKKAKRAARKEERKQVKIHAADIRGHEIRLLKEDKDPPPKMEKVLTEEETEALAAKKAAKRERKKERLVERTEMRKKARIMAGLPPEPEIKPGAKRQLPSKAERKAWKQLKNEERTIRRKKRFAEKAQRKREKALAALDSTEGIRIEPEVGGEDHVVGNSDFIAFDNELPVASTSKIRKKPKAESVQMEVDAGISTDEARDGKKRKRVKAEPVDAEATLAIDEESVKPKRKKRKTQVEESEEAGAVPAKKKKRKSVAAEDADSIEALAPLEKVKKRKKIGQAGLLVETDNVVTASDVHDAILRANGHSKRPKDKKPKSIGGSLAADGQSIPAKPATVAVNGHSSVVSITDVSKKLKKKRKDAMDVDGILNGADRLDAVGTW